MASGSPSEPDHPQNEAAPASKRSLLKLLGAGTLSTGVHMPAKWSAPLVAAVVLPVHAQSSVNPTPDPCGETGSDKGGPTKNDPEACCDSVRPANPSYPTDPTYLDEGCCAKTGKTDPTICCDDNVAVKTDVRYIEQCCDKPGRDENGNLVKNGQGEYICCDGLDQNSADYNNYCCENQARDPVSGDLVKDTSGNVACCEGSSKDPAYCCIKQEISYSKSIARTRTDWTTAANTNLTQVPTVRLPKWDPALGPLAEVHLTVTGDVDATGTIENKGLSAVTATFTGSLKLVTKGPNGVLLLAEPDAVANQGLEAADATTGSGDDFWVLPTISASKTEQKVITDPAELANYYIGQGEEVDIEMTATGTIAIEGGSNFRSDIDTFAAATISITYFCKASLA